MSIISVKWADNHLTKFGTKIDQLKADFPKVLPRIVNQVGNRAKTQVVRNLTKQTGLPRATIVKAIGNPSAARFGKLSYEMVTRGGNVRLKYLDPKETRKGVSAKPFGKRTLFSGTFMMGGKFPNRKDVGKFEGHVMFRNRSSGRQYSVVRSGVVIPQEMTSGATSAAFERTAAPLLQQRVEAALRRLVP